MGFEFDVTINELVEAGVAGVVDNTLLLTGGQTFDTTIESLRGQYGLNEAQAKQVMAQWVEERKAEERRKEERHQARGRSIKNFFRTITLVTALGIALGSGLGFYRGVNNRVLQNRMAGLAQQEKALYTEYTKKEQAQQKAIAARKAELERQYLGKLEHLLTLEGNSGFTVLERQFLLEKYLPEYGFAFGAESSIFYEVVPTKERAGISSRVYPCPKKKNAYNILVLKKDSTGAVTSAHIFNGEGQDFSKAVPVSSVQFLENQKIRVLDYIGNAVNNTLDAFWHLSNNYADNALR